MMTIKTSISIDSH